MHKSLLIMSLSFFAMGSALEANPPRHLDDGSKINALFRAEELSARNSMINSIFYQPTAGEVLSEFEPSVLFRQGLSAWVQAGNNPREYLENAFGRYVSDTSAILKKQKISLSFDKNMTALDKALVLKEFTSKAENLDRKEEFSQHAQIHFYLDESHLKSMKAKFGEKTFESLYGKALSEGPMNPVRVDRQIESEEDIVALQQAYASDEFFVNEMLPDFRQDWNRRPTRLIYHHLGDGPIRTEDGSSPVIVSVPSQESRTLWSDIEGNLTLLQEEIRRTNASGRDVWTQNRVFSSLDEVSNEVLNKSILISVSSNTVGAVRDRILKTPIRSQAGDVEALIQSARETTYGLCRQAQSSH